MKYLSPSSWSGSWLSVASPRSESWAARADAIRTETQTLTLAEIRNIRDYQRLGVGSPNATGILCDECWLTTEHWECDEIELYSPVILIPLSVSLSAQLIPRPLFLWMRGMGPASSQAQALADLGSWREDVQCPGSRKFDELTILDHTFHTSRKRRV